MAIPYSGHLRHDIDRASVLVPPSPPKSTTPRDEGTDYGETHYASGFGRRTISGSWSAHPPEEQTQSNTHPSYRNLDWSYNDDVRGPLHEHTALIRPGQVTFDTSADPDLRDGNPFSSRLADHAEHLATRFPHLDSAHVSIDTGDGRGPRDTGMLLHHLAAGHSP